MDVTMLLIIIRSVIVSNTYLFQYIDLRCINNYTRDIDLSWVVLSRDNWNYRPASLINPNIRQLYFQLQRMDLLIYLSKHDSNYFSIHRMLYDQLILLSEYKYTLVRKLYNYYKSPRTESTVPAEHFWEHMSSNTYGPPIFYRTGNCSQNKRANVGASVWAEWIIIAVITQTCRCISERA